jgi:hypothetical protein
MRCSNINKKYHKNYMNFNKRLWQYDKFDQILNRNK